MKKFECKASLGLVLEGEFLDLVDVLGVVLFVLLSAVVPLL